MYGRWFRFYDDVLNDPKVQALEPKLFKIWVNLMCLASKHDGVLPETNSVSFALRLSVSEVENAFHILKELGLIDIRVKRSTTYFEMHNWLNRQYKSDCSTERVRAFRKRFRNVSSTVSETPPDTDSTDTEQKQIQSQKQMGRETLAFGEFANVILTNEEHKKLMEKFGEVGAIYWIEELSRAIASKNLKFKSHYATILSWQRLEEKKHGRQETAADRKDREREEANRRILERFERTGSIFPGKAD